MKDWEKRFDEEFVFIGTNNDEGGHYDYPSLNTSSPNEIKHFLATALEEQREKYIEQVEKMKLEMLPNLEGADGKYVEENNRR